MTVNAVRKCYLLTFGAFAVLASLASATSARAATLSIQCSPCSAGALDGSFNPDGWTAPDGVGSGTPVTVFSSTSGGSGGLYISPQNVVLTFTFVGKEALSTGGALDALSFNNTEIFRTTDAVGTFKTATYDVGGNPGLVPFLFVDITGGNATAINGGAIAAPSAIAFALVNATTAYAFFDNTNGGGGADRDFDDMVVRITAADAPLSAPLPGALPLFVSGALAIGLLGRRRKPRQL